MEDAWLAALPRDNQSKVWMSFRSFSFINFRYEVIFPLHTFPQQCSVLIFALIVWESLFLIEACCRAP